MFIYYIYFKKESLAVLSVLKRPFRPLLSYRGLDVFFADAAIESAFDGSSMASHMQI